MTSSDSDKFSLWLRPHGDVAFALQQRIDELADKYGTPSFEPHVTLLGGLTGRETGLIQLTDTLASYLHPFELKLTEAGIGNTYYRSLFACGKETEVLLKARENARRLFDVDVGKNSEDDYFPHLSLLYGELSRDEKQRILNVIGRKFYITFTVQNLLLVKTTGKPDRWKKIHSSEFANN